MSIFTRIKQKKIKEYNIMIRLVEKSLSPSERPESTRLNFFIQNFSFFCLFLFISAWKCLKRGYFQAWFFFLPVCLCLSIRVLIWISTSTITQEWKIIESSKMFQNVSFSEKITHYILSFLAWEHLVEICRK